MKRTQLKSFFILLKLIYELLLNYTKLTIDDYERNYAICQKICNEVIQTLDLDIQIYGKREIPKNNPYLLVSNHRSFFDIIMLIATIEKPISFAVAKELCNYPILKKYIHSIRCISIDRENKDILQVKEQIENISSFLEKNALALFPEGECNYFNDEIKEFKKGGFVSAIQTNTLILPTYIKFSDYQYIKRWVIPKGEVKIFFSSPFTPQEVFPKKAKAKQLTLYSYEKILELQKKSFKQ